MGPSPSFFKLPKIKDFYINSLWLCISATVDSPSGNILSFTTKSLIKNYKLWFNGDLIFDISSSNFGRIEFVKNESTAGVVKTQGSTVNKCSLPWMNFCNQEFSVFSEISEGEGFVVEITFEKSLITRESDLIYSKKYSGRTSFTLIEDYLEIEGFIFDFIERPIMQFFNGILCFDYEIPPTIGQGIYKYDLTIPLTENTNVKAIYLSSSKYTAKFELKVNGIRFSGGSYESVNSDVKLTNHEKLIFSEGNDTFHSGLNIRKDDNIVLSVEDSDAYDTFGSISVINSTKVSVICINSFQVSF